MKRRSGWLGIVLLIALLVGCAPAAEEQSAPVEDVPVVAPNNLADEELTEEEEEAVQPMPTNEEEEAVQEPEEGEQVVTPVSVDLGAITPEAATEGEEEPREAPAPGIPNPETKLVNDARQRLADRLRIDISEVSLVSIEAVEWRDGSLGCPEPGMGYIQVITPGYEIILEAAGDEFHFHTDMSGRIVYCEDPQEPASRESSS